MAGETKADGEIVTFYSYKGGTGRTMALANIAWILASNGLKVLVVDWDLDSPGLHRYFHPFLDRQRVAATPGVVELISDYAWGAAQPPRPAADRHRAYVNIPRHAIPLNWGYFPSGGALDYIPPGRQNLDYSSSFASIDWDNFYGRLGGGRFIDSLREDMKARYDYTLIDSQTGVSDIVDICTAHLPDSLVDCFTLNDQSIEGAAALAGAVDGRYHDRNIRMLPVPMRIDQTEKDKVEKGLTLARLQFDQYLKGMATAEKDLYWAAVAVPYRADYAFEETLAAFGDDPAAPRTLLAAYERLAAAITVGRVCALGEMSSETRLASRRSFARPHPLTPALPG